MLSTHIVDDVRDLCSQMAIIDHGTVVLEGTPSRLLDDVRGRVWQRTVDRSQTVEQFPSLQLLSSKRSGGARVLRVFSEIDPGNGFVMVEPELEDVYFHRVGQPA